MGFYSYMWLREDGSPYYVGKGTRRRAYVRHTHRVAPPTESSRILVFPMLSEAEAFESEIALIELFGRKDIGTGCLRNLTDGGENPPKGCLKGRKLSEAHKLKLALAKIGTRGNHTGFKHSDETKQKMRKPRSYRWTLTEATKQKQLVASVAREARKREAHA